MVFFFWFDFYLKWLWLKDYIEKHGEEDFKRFLEEELGGWPILNENYNVSKFIFYLKNYNVIEYNFHNSNILDFYLFFCSRHLARSFQFIFRQRWFWKPNSDQWVFQLHQVVCSFIRAELEFDDSRRWHRKHNWSGKALCQLSNLL